MFNFYNYFNSKKNCLCLLCIVFCSVVVAIMVVAYLWTVNHTVPNNQTLLLQQYQQKLCDLNIYSYCHHSDANYDYVAYLKSFSQIALGASQRDIPEDIIRAALASVRPKATSEQSVQHDELLDYLFTEINAEDIAWLLEQYQQHQIIINDVAKDYQINPYVLGAIWLLDQVDFLTRQENIFSYLVAILSQLSFSYETESKIYSAMEIMLQNKLMPNQLLVGISGNLGNTHFSSQEYLDYAIDINQDGVANVWDDSKETLASIANYLKKNGWSNQLDLETYGVITPTSFIWDVNFHNLWNCQGPMVLISDGYLLSSWSSKGMMQDNKSPLPEDQDKTIFYFLGNKLNRIGNQWHGFLVNRNYFVIMQYACSVKYALKVSLIAKILSTIIL